MSADTHDIKKEVKKYYMVFAALLVFTVITVAVSKFHIGITLGIIVALVIAAIKGTLVACNFMHLSSEKKLIYLIVGLAAFLFVSMLLLLYFSYYSIPLGAQHVS